MAWGLPPPGGGGKRGRDTKVSLPLLTPQPFLRTRLPPVARLKARGPQGRLLLQEYTLDGSGAFRSDGVTALHRLAAHCYAWQTAQGKFRASRFYITTPTHGSVPPSPPFRRATAGSRVLRKVWGVKRGKKTLVVFPLLPPPPGGGIPSGRGDTASLASSGVAAVLAKPFTLC